MYSLANMFGEFLMEKWFLFIYIWASKVPFLGIFSKNEHQKIDLIFQKFQKSSGPYTKPGS